MIKLAIITGFSVALAFAHEITPDKRLRKPNSFRPILGTTFGFAICIVSRVNLNR